MADHSVVGPEGRVKIPPAEARMTAATKIARGAPHQGQGRRRGWVRPSFGFVRLRVSLPFPSCAFMPVRARGRKCIVRYSLPAVPGDIYEVGAIMSFRTRRLHSSPDDTMCVSRPPLQINMGPDRMGWAPGMEDSMNRFEKEYWDGAREMALMFYESMRSRTDVPGDLKQLAETALRETAERKNRDFRDALGVTAPRRA